MDKRAIYKSDLEEIQKIELGILKEFIRICEKHSLKYYLLEGSLLGAIRHQGMIPWDDDIDVGMFREDFEKFLQVAHADINHPYIVSNFRIRKGYKDYITQISNSEEKVETSFRKEHEIVNVWIDVFVIDGMPKGRFNYLVHKYNLLFRKMLMMWSDLDHYLVSGRDNRPYYEKIAIKLCRVLHFEKYINNRRALEKMDICMKKYDANNTKKSINFMSEYKWRTEFPIEYYGKGRIVDFDGIQARIPSKAEEILESVYGNYMELPPEGKRYKHSLKLFRKE